MKVRQLSSSSFLTIRQKRMAKKLSKRFQRRRLKAALKQAEWDLVPFRLKNYYKGWK